ncbi:tRNA (adenine(22)-N(1))-methyltransferase [Salibacterium sp. K-3]
MNHEILSERLRTVAEKIPAGSVIADIGTDHGAIPIYAVKHNLAPHAVASDVNTGPLAAAQTNVEKEQLEHRIHIRSGNGLHVLREEDNVDTVIISGMGGSLITSILEDGKAWTEGLRCLILQPNLGAVEIRRWFINNNWVLKSEDILEENNKIYEILTAVPGDPHLPYSSSLDAKEAELLFGPFLMRQKKSVFIKKWMREKEEWKRVLEQLTKAEHPDQVRGKKQELMRKIQLAEEVLHCETS